MDLFYKMRKRRSFHLLFVIVASSIILHLLTSNDEKRISLDRRDDGQQQAVTLSLNTKQGSEEDSFIQTDSLPDIDDKSLDTNSPLDQTTLNQDSTTYYSLDDDGDKDSDSNEIPPSNNYLNTNHANEIDFEKENFHSIGSQSVKRDSMRDTKREKELGKSSQLVDGEKPPSTGVKRSLIQSYGVKRTSNLKKRNDKSKQRANQLLNKSTVESFKCEYEGLGMSTSGIDPNQACLPYPRNKQDCENAFDYMSPVKKYGVKCNKHDVEEEPICLIKTPYRYNIDDKVDIQCNPEACEDEILVGCVDKHYGIMRDNQEWQTFLSVNKLKRKLPHIIRQSSINGFNYCFLKCKGDSNAHVQPLIFPPVVQQRRTSSAPGINVNIVLEDAVSRSHFYRSLPRTVKTLRSLAKTEDSGVKVLDFELVQSYASFTLSNIRALFSGEKTMFNSIRESGIYDMLSRFKENGFQTLVQEDLCFFDYWGTILSENYNKKLKPFSRKLKQFYEKYLKIANAHIDNKGLTSLACEHLRNHGYTNPFQFTHEKCLNGDVISHYMLNYVARFLLGIESSNNNAPAIVYTHLNTAHEKSGERIRFDDISLSDHISALSKLRNTITVILSDHGSKTTEYSIADFHGRLEVFSPLMFVIIPDSVARRLGHAAMTNLINNQKRLVALVDLHGMLNMIMTRQMPAVNDYRVSGLLAPIPNNRTCGDIKGLSSDAYCRCNGWNHFIDTKHQTVRWLAEVALGEINNRITKQYTQSSKTTKTSLGYGACARFKGDSIEQARQSFEGSDVITTLLLIVIPIYGSRSKERFEVTVKRSTVSPLNVQVMDILRVSVYGKYETCADKGVDVKLCACADGAIAESIRPQMDFKTLLRQTHFGIKTSLQTFDFSQCLLFAKRKFRTKTIQKMQTRLKAFEIANICADKSVKVRFGGKVKKSKISRVLPFEMTINPRSVVFLYAVDNDWKYGRFKPLISLAKDSQQDSDEHFEESY